MGMRFCQRTGGGRIFIGMDDRGEVVGVKNAKKLMEDIPSKIRQQLGLVCEVNLHEQGKLSFIEISVKPSSVPVSFRGHYFYRTGTVKTELTGIALNEFLLKKSGKSWELMIEESADSSDLDSDALSQFVEDAAAAGRIPDAARISHEELLEKLRVVENGKITRAALVLFGKDPGRFFPNLMVKIGRFNVDDTDLRFQETAEGNLIRVLREVIELLQHKFLVKPVRFEGIHRIEEWEYPMAALREIVLNALVHRNYMGAMTQIRVYDDKLNVWNAGELPKEISIAQLMKAHPSIPRNPLIADVCYRAGYIDTWGRGIQKIVSACRESGLDEPQFEDVFGGLRVTLTGGRFTATLETVAKTGSEKSSEKSSEKILTLLVENPSLSAKDLAEAVGMSSRAVEKQLAILKNKGRLKRIGPAKGGYWQVIAVDEE